MTDINKIDAAYAAIHEQITLPLDEGTKEQYELFSKFMELYEAECSLRNHAFRELLDTGEVTLAFIEEGIKQ